MIKKSDCNLRKIEDQDCHLILAWRNLNHIRTSMFSSNIISVNDHEKWFSKLADNNTVDYQIFEYRCKPVGVVCFTEIDRFNMRTFWGFYLGEQGLPKYSGLLMGLLGLEYCFNRYRFHKVYGEVIECNKASMAYHEKLGFIKEGCFSDHIIKDGKYESVIRYALYSEEWKRHKDSLYLLMEG